MLHTGGRWPVPGTSASGTVPTKPFMASSKSWRSAKGKLFAISVLALSVAGSGPFGTTWARAGALARTTRVKTLRNNIGGTQEVDEHGKGLVGVLLVDPVGAALEGRGLQVLQPRGGQLALQPVAGRALAGDCQGRHLRQPRGVGLGEKFGVAVECLVAHEGCVQAAIELQRRDVARDVVGHDLAGLGARVHEPEHQRLFPALPFGDGLVDLGETREMLGARIGRREALEFGGAGQALGE